MSILVIKIPGSYTNIVIGVVMVMFSLVFPLCYLTSDVMNTGWSGVPARPSLLQHFISCSSSSYSPTPLTSHNLENFTTLIVLSRLTSQNIRVKSCILKLWNNRVKQMLTIVSSQSQADHIDKVSNVNNPGYRHLAELVLISG